MVMGRLVWLGKSEESWSVRTAIAIECWRVVRENMLKSSSRGLGFVGRWSGLVDTRADR